MSNSLLKAETDVFTFLGLAEADRHSQAIFNVCRASKAFAYFVFLILRICGDQLSPVAFQRTHQIETLHLSDAVILPGESGFLGLLENVGHSMRFSFPSVSLTWLPKRLESIAKLTIRFLTGFYDQVNMLRRGE